MPDVGYYDVDPPEPDPICQVCLGNAEAPEGAPDGCVCPEEASCCGVGPGYPCNYPNPSPEENELHKVHDGRFTPEQRTIIRERQRLSDEAAKADMLAAEAEAAHHEEMRRLEAEGHFDHLREARAAEAREPTPEEDAAADFAYDAARERARRRF